MRFLILLIPLLFISACVQSEGEEQMISVCKQLCELEKMTKDISNGPCLSNDIGSTNSEKWVCDVAHSPREDIDNQPENQCSAFREGVAKHFVEVDVNCELIKKY